MIPGQGSQRYAICAERVFDGRRWHEHAAVLVERGRIARLSAWADVPEECPQERLPEGAMLAPGFVDLQVNGGGGVLLNDRPTADGMRAIAAAHRKLGTTAILPTLITDTRGQMIVAIEAAREAAGRDGVIGLHIEGPFLSPLRPGIHRKDRIATAEMRDLDVLRRLPPHSMVTLAPECVPPGFIRALVEAGIRVSAGHSEASADVMQRAVEEGLTGVTHLYNAMPPLAGRAPGIVGTALAEPRLTAGLIVDGIHVDPISVRAAFAAKGAGGIALVSDAMPSVGSAEAQFQLMDRTISLRDGKLTSDDGTLAGAHLDMAAAVRNAVTLAGIPVENALRAALLTPAKFLGIEKEHGVIAPGAHADLVVLSDELKVLSVWAGGERVS
jgi:N-acetylglucosamine-6-phosphate deacetylase